MVVMDTQKLTVTVDKKVLLMVSTTVVGVPMVMDFSSKKREKGGLCSSGKMVHWKCLK